MAKDLGARRNGRASSTALVAVAVAACVPGCKRAPEAGPGTVRLIEKFDAKKVEGAAAEKAVRALPRTEWRFDAAAPAAAPTPPSGAAAGGRHRRPSRPRAASRPARAWPAWPSATASWSAAPPPPSPSCTSSARRASTTPTSSTRSRSACASRRAPTCTRHRARRRRSTWSRSCARALRCRGRSTTPVVAGDRDADLHDHAAGAHLRLAHPPRADPAHRRRREPTFAIESVRLVFRREHLAERALGRELAGPARRLPRDAGDALAGDRALRG